MKSTGVIRRIDELGRIVIPKEIRRNLGIRDGENVEIFTDNDSIILKKYCRMTTNIDLANNLCEIINNVFNYNIIITDREKVIASRGYPNIIDKKLSQEYLNIIERREITEKENLLIEDNNIEEKFVLVPIISLNDSIGLVIISKENNTEDATNIGKLISNIFSRKLDI